MVERYAITNFSNGEASPRVRNRVTETRYLSTCRTMQNFIGLAQGPAEFCAGTEYIASVKDSTKRVWLVPFRHSREQSYVLEFGDQYLRFYVNHGQLLSGGSPYEIATPYTLADLTSDDGTLALRFYQSGDVLFIVHPLYWPRELSRLGATNWTLTKFEPDDGPFADLNTTTTTVYASATTGSVTLTASTGIFASTDVDSLFYLESVNPGTVTPWRNGVAVTAGNQRRVDLRVYEATNSATTGTTTPTHTENIATDGSVGWRYLHAGAGWVRITAYSSATSVTATVLGRLPDEVVGSGNATTLWSPGAWSDTRGFPSQVAFFRERLAFGQGLKVQFSESGTFRSFRFKTAGEITAANGFTRELNLDSASRLHWFVAARELRIGTDGGELAIQELANNEPFGPENATAVPATRYGSRDMAALAVNDVAFFAQASGRKVREYFYDFSRDQFRGPDMTFLAEHVTKGGIIDMAYAPEPVPTLYCVRADGTLLQMVYERENDVVGWSRRITGGDGIIEAVAAISSPDGDQDDLWLVVRRTVNGSTVRYVERLHHPLQEGDSLEDAWYLDCAVQYSGSATASISGLDHLEGETVQVLADGAIHPDVTIASGAITLEYAASKVLVGLGYTGVLEPQAPEADTRMGSAIGERQRVGKLVVSLLNSGGGQNTKMGVGSDLYTIIFRRTVDDLESPPPLFTGTAEVNAAKGWHDGEPYRIEQGAPLPMTVLAIVGRQRVGG